MNILIIVVPPSARKLNKATYSRLFPSATRAYEGIHAGSCLCFGIVWGVREVYLFENYNFGNYEMSALRYE